MKFYFLALGTLLVVCVGCAYDGGQVHHQDTYQAPPAAQMVNPGPMVAGPGPGVIPPLAPPPARPFQVQATQVRFLGPEGMVVGWQIGEGFAENQLIAPGRYEFAQGATYRLKMANIPGREGLVIYPTLQVYPAHPTTDAYLSHNSIPIRLTDEDLDQIETNNFVTKVIYLPDPQFQELAIAGVEELVSTRLDPGLDPIAEADRRGTIMAVLRVGNKDFEMPTIGVEVGVLDEQGNIQTVGHVVQVDGERGEHVPPVPILPGANPIPYPYGVPYAPIVANTGYPGQPAYNPISGANAPVWGYPVTGTPIGLPGPTHLPYGRPAGLRSHTVRNLTDVDVGEPVDDMLIDVRHEPGIRLPHPVKHIEYTEKHPAYAPGQVSWPAWSAPYQPGAAPYGEFHPEF